MAPSKFKEKNQLYFCSHLNQENLVKSWYEYVATIYPLIYDTSKQVYASWEKYRCFPAHEDVSLQFHGDSLMIDIEFTPCTRNPILGGTWHGPFCFLETLIPIMLHIRSSLTYLTKT